jgi:hemolysin activation/secretion protein
MRATHAAASRPVAAQQRAKEYALEYENSKLSQLQPEPEPEPDVPQVNVLDDETMAELLFQEIDVDGSGTLDWGEIDALAKQLGQPLSEEELTAAMLEMDEDGNGTRSPLVFYGLAAISDLPGC